MIRQGMVRAEVSRRRRAVPAFAKKAPERTQSRSLRQNGKLFDNLDLQYFPQALGDKESRPNGPIFGRDRH